MANKRDRYNSLDQILTDPTLRSFLPTDGEASSRKERKTGQQFSDKELKQMQFDINQKQEEREYNEYLYNQYQSPQAMMRQYQEAGLNPALMYEGAGSGGSVASSTDSPTAASEPTQEETPLATAMPILQLLMDAGSVGSEIDNKIASSQNIRRDSELKTAEVLKTKAETDNIAADTEGKLTANRIAKINEEYARINNELDIENKRIEIDKKLGDIREQASRISVNDSIIEINGQKIQLIDKQLEQADADIVLKLSQSYLHNVNAENIKAMLPYQQAVAEARAKLDNAQIGTTKAQAKKELEQAQQAYLENMVKQGMIDQGLVDTLMRQEDEKWKKSRNERMNNTVGTFVSSAEKVNDAVLGWFTFGQNKKRSEYEMQPKPEPQRRGEWTVSLE